MSSGRGIVALMTKLLACVPCVAVVVAGCAAGSEFDPPAVRADPGIEVGSDEDAPPTGEETAAPGEDSAPVEDTPDPPPPEPDTGAPGDKTLPTLPYGCGILGNCPTDIYPYPLVRPFSNGKELCAWINSCRVAYSFHARCGGTDSDDPCTPNVAATWPMKLEWDPTAGAQAQAEADKLAKGGSPSGTHLENTYDMCNTTYSSFGVWTQGLGTSRYTVTAKDIGSAWKIGGGGCSALGKHLAYFRTSLAYVDSCSAPKLPHFGCGVADAGGGNVWGVVVMVP